MILLQYDSDNLPYEKVGKNEPVCIADEVPFEIPESWEWVRISSLGSIVRGSGIKKTETVEFGKPCVRYGELYTTYHTSFDQTVSFVSEELFERCKHFSYGDILMTLTGENKPDIAKAVAYLGNDIIAAGGDLAYWTAHGMNPLYLTYLMASPYVIGRKVNLATGDIIVHISGDKLGTILIPVPPLYEQQRIVDKILEVEVKLIEYTGKEISLDVLQKNFPDVLKKSILQWAIQGKLVPQDPADEPASILLERIRAEKKKLIDEGKIKKDKHESIIFRRDNSHYEKLDGVERCIDDEILFELPENWVWARFGTAMINRDAERIPLSVNEREKLEKIYDYYGASGVIDKVDRYLFSKPLLLIGEDGANLLTRSKPIAFIARGQYWVNNHAHVLDSSDGLLLEYVAAYINAINLAPYVTGTAQPKMNQEKMNSILIPIPPTGEQLCIVQKINQIFPVIENM
ncbi:restriction endonuclease subunit S [Lachnospiraceae bacterium 50-23]